ncbi:MAG: hypothetical protein ACKOWJ_05900 [Micrococcales bacterium]
MSSSIAISRLPVRRALQQLGSKYSYYYDTIIGFAFPAILTNLVNDAIPTKGGVADWLAISFAGYLAAAAVFLLGRAILFNRSRVPTVVTLVVFAFAGVARGIVIYSLGNAYGVVASHEFVYRVFGSMLYTFFMLGLITVLVSNAVRSSRKYDELEHQRLLLQDALVNLREKLSIQKAELAGRVKALVNPMIDDLISKIAASRAEGSVAVAVASLKSTVDRDIRPLSLQIGNDQTPGLFEATGKPAIKFRLFTKLQSPIQVASMYSPIWFMLLLVMVAAPAASHIFGNPNWGYQIALVGVIGILLLELAKRSTAKLQLTQTAAFFVQLTSYALIGAVVDIALTLSPFNTVQYTPGRVTLYVVVAGIGFFIGQLFQLQREESAAYLATTNENLERLNAEARRELWLYRRKLATVLHGPVQARLYASAIRLSQAKRVSAKLVEQINGELKEVLRELDFDKQDRASARSVIRQVIDVWAGTCEIYPKIDKSVMQAAKRDPNFEAAFIEVIREAISNAVKHGQATEIELNADTFGDLVKLRLINNGKLLPSDSKGKAGFGTELISELTLRWSVGATSDDRTVFEADFVIAGG